MNILITGAGGPAAICAYKSLSAAGYNVFMGDMDPMSAGLYLVKEGNQFILPAGKSEQFIPFLLHLCKKHKIDLLIPTVDCELLPAANNLDAFEAIGCKVMVSPTEALEVCQDKYLLMEACKNNVALGKYDLFENFTAADLADKKWIVKPRNGSGSRDIFTVRNNEDFKNLSHLAGKNFMVQEFLEGKEYSIDMMIDKDGKVCTAVARERMRTDSGVAVTSKVTKNTAIIKYAIAVAESLDLKFAINVQVIDTAGKGPLLLEINPRFSGGLSLIIAAGADIPLMCAENLLENKPVEIVNNYKEIAMVRYFQEKFFDPSLFLQEASSDVFTYAV